MTLIIVEHQFGIQRSTREELFLCHTDPLDLVSRCIHYVALILVSFSLPPQATLSSPLSDLSSRCPHLSQAQAA